MAEDEHEALDHAVSTGRATKTLEVRAHWTARHGQRFLSAWKMGLDDGVLYNVWFGRLGFEIARRT